MLNECSDNTEAVIIIENQNYYRHYSLLQSSIQAIYLLQVEQTNDLEKYKAMTHDPVHLENTKIIRSLPSKKFILDEISEGLFELALFKLRYSIWWNIHGFFIIKRIQTIGSCKFAYSFLQTVWQFNILNAIFLCNDFNYGIRFYTFNPYSRTAPKVWQRVGMHRQKNGHPLTLFANINQTMGRYFENLFY